MPPKAVFLFGCRYVLGKYPMILSNQIGAGKAKEDAMKALIKEGSRSGRLSDF